MMTFGFGEVEGLLAKSRRISDARRTAFQARLKNFHRLGFPADIKAGRGKAAKYRPHHVLLMDLALELSELGVSPERAVRTLEQHLGVIIQSLLHSVRPVEEEMPDDWSPMILYFDPHALADLTEEGAADGALPFWFAPNDDFTRDLRVWVNKGLLRLSVINLSAILYGLELNLPPETAGEFLGELSEWAETEFEKLTPKPYVAHRREEFDLQKLRKRLFDRKDFARGKPEKPKPGRRKS